MPACASGENGREACVPRAPEDAIAEFEQCDLRRFDVEFDLPEHLTPEFPPPIFLTTHTETRASP
jgi:hypothetical protein